MKTSTIYRALDCVREASAFFATEKRVRQAGTFERELLRRMDERDALVAPRRVFLTPERIGQYMARLSEDMKADDILRGGK